MAGLTNLFHLSHVTFLFDMFRTAISGIEWFVLAYVLCILLLFIVGKELYNLTFVYPFFFMLLTIFNPFLIVPLSEFIGLTVRIRRIFWLLPVNLVLAFAAVKFVFALKEMWKKAAAVLVLCAMIILAGSGTRSYMLPLENPYKTSNVILAISDFLMKDAEEHNMNKRVMYSSQQLLELRQFDPSIESLFRRVDLLDWSIPDTSEETVQAVIKSNHRVRTLALANKYSIQIDPEVFLFNAKKCQVDYIIQETDSNMADYYASVQFLKVAEIGPYEIFRAEFAQ